MAEISPRTQPVAREELRAPRRGRSSPPRTSPTRSSSSTTADGRDRQPVYTPGRASPTSAADRTCPAPRARQGLQADQPRRRLLARRRAQHAAHPHLRHGLRHQGRARRLPRAPRGGARSATTAGSARELDLFHLPGAARLALLASQGRHASLERCIEDCGADEHSGAATTRSRRRMILRRETYGTSGHCDNYRDNIFVPARSTTARLRAQADELPRPHAHLRISLRSYRDLPLRFAELARCTATSSAARCTGSCACATSPRTTRTSSAPPSRSRTRSRGCVRLQPHIYAAFGFEDVRIELSTRPEKRSAPTRSGTHRGRAHATRSRAAEIAYELQPGRRRLLRPQDRLAHTRRPRPRLAVRHDPARLPACPSAST